MFNPVEKNVLGDPYEEILVILITFASTSFLVKTGPS